MAVKKFDWSDPKKGDGSCFLCTSSYGLGSEKSVALAIRHGRIFARSQLRRYFDSTHVPSIETTQKNVKKKSTSQVMLGFGRLRRAPDHQSTGIVYV